ncbi:MAG: alpha/beta hydrolase [Planctomycetota bacterium]|nr:alpha/beta hydrolase [Planctomycetota bacterium]
MLACWIRLVCIFVLVTLLGMPSGIAAEPLVLDLWPDGVPLSGQKAESSEEVRTNKNGILRITNVTRPQMTVYRPNDPNGAAVLVCPGGGYKILAYEHEGTDVCEFLTEHGVTAILLKYRVPSSQEVALQDAQRAIGMIHHHAEEWGIDPDRIGMLGFSAGGNLTVMTCLHGSERTYEIDEKLDINNPTPSFAIPVYPAYLVERGTEGPLLSAITVKVTSPPLCLVHAADDPWTASSSFLLAVEYKKHDVPCEVHVYAKGGHGFGMKKKGLPVDAWPDRVVEWMDSMGYLTETDLN